MEEKMDLLLKGGTVIDPVKKEMKLEDIGIHDGKIAARAPAIPETDAKITMDVSGCCVTPGLIDMHCHIYPVFPYPKQDSLRTVNGQEHMFSSGVTTAVDAGTCGWRNFGDFKEQVIDKSALRVLAFLNIAAKGMAYTKSEQSPNDIFPEITAALAEEFDDIIVGIKSAHYWAKPFDIEHPPWASIDGARKAADLCKKNIMVDSIPVLPQRSYSSILDRMKPGDIHTHVFAQQFPLLDNQGKLEAHMEKARNRGIFFDVGHGSGSFWFRQAAGCLKEGFLPDTISTDLHHQNVTGPAINLLYVMSKFLAMGITLEKIIEKTTVTPALALNRRDLGTLNPGACADVAVLRLRNGIFGYMDCGGARFSGRGKLECVATIREGRVVYDPEAKSMPDWESAPEAYWKAPGLLREWEPKKIRRNPCC